MNETHFPRPLYQLQARTHGKDELELTLWELPCAATPHITKPVRIAGLKGRNLALVESMILRRLHRAGIRIAPLGSMVQRFAVDEELALNLGLLCRVLAPMRHAERMRLVALRIEAMNPAEAAYWLGMAMHRKNPRRVLCALRLLLTDPHE
ncbi:DUF7680 family protein [Desulfovibrio piger]|uniref:DUF7680 family protein n=1 Tax=Desulfovibrio piger TaxID=901 RepID=UPI0026F351AA|nr:hypothetical protein [Desulfovibrio piger]